MNRRDFLKRLGGASASVALSPMLDLAEIIEAPEALCYKPYEVTVIGIYALICSNPRRLGVIRSISNPSGPTHGWLRDYFTRG